MLLLLAAGAPAETPKLVAALCMDSVSPTLPAYRPVYEADEVPLAGRRNLRAEALALKELVADLSLENRLLKKNMTGVGGDGE